MKEQSTLKEINLRKAIEEGIESGIDLDFDPEKHLEMLKAKSILTQKTVDDLTRKVQ